MTITFDIQEFISNTKKIIGDQESLPFRSMLVLSSTFWTAQALFHYGSGQLSLHAGRLFPIPIIAGCMFTSSSLLLSQYVNHKVNMLYDDEQSHISSKNKSTFINKDTIRMFYLGLASFLFLEGGFYSIPFTNFFKTALPTSVTTTGAFANSISKNWLSILATSEVASESQKNIIQRIGYKYG